MLLHWLVWVKVVWFINIFTFLRPCVRALSQRDLAKLEKLTKFPMGKKLPLSTSKVPQKLRSDNLSLSFESAFCSSNGKWILRNFSNERWPKWRLMLSANLMVSVRHACIESDWQANHGTYEFWIRWVFCLFLVPYSSIIINIKFIIIIVAVVVAEVIEGTTIRTHTGTYVRAFVRAHRANVISIRFKWIMKTFIEFQWSKFCGSAAAAAAAAAATALPNHFINRISCLFCLSQHTRLPRSLTHRICAEFCRFEICSLKPEQQIQINEFDNNARIERKTKSL